VSKVKYFTKDTLILANNVAVATERNRSLYEDRLETLPEGVRFPLGFTMIHNGCEMRIQVTVASDAFGKDIGQVWLDIPFDTYNALPEAEVPE